MTTISPPLPLLSWQGRRILALLCAVAFLDFVDASITNVALPHILTSLRFSVQSLQWVELQADSPLAAVAPEPTTKEI